MKIGVLVKQVPGSDRVKIDRKTGTIRREKLEAIPNPKDLYAIEVALRIREVLQEAEITAISMGPLRAREVLEEAIAMGCDQGILISDPALGGSDTWVTAYVLATLLQQMSPFTLLFTGERSTDGETGQDGPELASLLDIPVITYVSTVEEVTPTTITVQRELEEGIETIAVTLPAVISVTKAVAEPRLPTLRGKKKAKASSIPVLTLQDLGLTREKVGLAGSPTRVTEVFYPTLTRQGKLCEGQDPDQAVEWLLHVLNEKGF
ncbi:MAG: electron transfer flavoprotein subunit beta/FixA family protein [Atribacterota bacterium]|nr:electron transfer flavoprotein subunit beta/FixA family protein [Atribacterota bacterium]